MVLSEEMSRVGWPGQYWIDFYTYLVNIGQADDFIKNPENFVDNWKSYFIQNPPKISKVEDDREQKILETTYDMTKLAASLIRAKNYIDL